MADCTCDKCVRACSHTPGWFRPGEAERAAKFLKMPMRRFFKKYLGVNWYTWKRNRPVFVLAPAITTMDAGHEFPGNPKGQCVFLKDRRCLIHPVKPHDCRAFLVCEDSDDEKARWQKDREQTVKLWSTERASIVKLLGRRPKTERMSILDMFFGLL